MSEHAAVRQPLSSGTIRVWQALIMRGLEPADGEPFGTYRGEAGLDGRTLHVQRPVGRSVRAADRVAAVKRSSKQENRTVALPAARATWR